MLSDNEDIHLWDLTKFFHLYITFGQDDKESILMQLSSGTRLILKNGIRGEMKSLITFKCRNRIIDGFYYMWLTNDERRQLLKTAALE
jgi:hypothetical protein